MSWKGLKSEKDYGYKSKNNDKFRSYIMEYLRLTKEKINKQFAFKLYDGYRNKYENRSN